MPQAGRELKYKRIELRFFVLLLPSLYLDFSQRCLDFIFQVNTIIFFLNVTQNVFFLFFFSLQVA